MALILIIVVFTKYHYKNKAHIQHFNYIHLYTKYHTR